ncbi:60S ribosomal protein L10a-2-like [Drosophila rhopaloa]|uniref:Large ribosomal subunit protein uL1 n=1 Tax=Drosophila rhopaloa TaxID=1041015 RepID=A0ABM5JFS1_DRORH|nr:60S ribosomal protein L10a-2-like [Drosophila rhopaloa]
MTSKISRETLYVAVKNILQVSQGKESERQESVELQIGLRDYDPEKCKRFYGSVLLHHLAVPQLKVCVLGDQQHCCQAKAIGVHCLDVEALKKLNKDPKLVKKLAKSYDAFLASESVIKQIPKLLGPGLTNAGKFPTPLTHRESMSTKIKILSTKKLLMKKMASLSVNVGHVGMHTEELTQNISLSINFLVSLLKENWQNVRSLHVKSSLGVPHRLY